MIESSHYTRRKIHRYSVRETNPLKPRIPYYANLNGRGTTLPTSERLNIISSDNENGHFLLKLMNALKKKAGMPMDIMSMALPKETDSAEEKQEKLSRNAEKIRQYFAGTPYNEQRPLPTFSTSSNDDARALESAFNDAAKQAGISTVQYASAAINDRLENKCATANAVNFFLSKEGQATIPTYLTEIRGMSPDEAQRTAQHITQKLEQFLIPTGTLSYPDKNEAEIEQELRKFLTQHQDQGIVFQLEDAATGNGTLILQGQQSDSTETVQQWLQSDKPLLDRFAEHKNFQHLTRDKLVKEFQKPEGVSWQELCNIKEEGSIIYRNQGSEQGLVPSMASIQVASKGTTKGNKVIPPEKFGSIAEDVGIISELLLDKQLRDRGFSKGMQGVFDHDTDYEMAIAGADFFITDNDELKISEFNIVSTGSTRALDSSLYHNAIPIYPSESAFLRPEAFPLSKDLKEAIESQGALGFDAYAELVHERCNSILERGATFTSAAGDVIKPSFDGGGKFLTDAPTQTDSHFITMCPTIFFPAIHAVDHMVRSSIESAEETGIMAHEQKIANDVGQAMRTITADDIYKKIEAVKAVKTLNIELDQPSNSKNDDVTHYQDRPSSSSKVTREKEEKSFFPTR